MNDDQKRLLASLRGALLTPAEAIATTGHMLKDIELKENVCDEYFEDIEAIQKASTKLYGFVKEQLTPAGFPSGGDFEGELRTVRHDIKNRLNHIMGPCQFLLEIYPDGLVGRDLKRVMEYSQTCLRALSQDSSSLSERESLPQSSALLNPSRDVEGHDRFMPDPASILVADDNALNREILERFLLRSGHTVTFAEDGREALELMAEQPYDLVLLDIIMPEMDGFQVLDYMEVTGKLSHTPVIVLTGLDDDQDAVRCIEIGAEDFLSRPVNLKLLRARVNACLEKKRLRERLYEQFFTPKLAREIVRHPDLLEMEGREAEVSVLFCDIRNFSTISERLGPSETIRWLRDVMGALSECVMRHNGVLVDYTGDELMAMWGAPGEEPDHAKLACSAAIDMLAELPKLDQRWGESIESPTAVGIGVNTGKVFVGNVGTSRKFKYGPLGNTVNLASRVQGATKYLRSTVLITGETHSRVAADFCARRVCHAKVNNIEEPVELFELAPAEHEGWESLRSSYEQALSHFYNKEFRKASSILGNVLVEHPIDGPSLVLMSRAVDSMLTSGESFDPVWTLPGK